MAVSFTSGNDFIIPTEDGQTYLGGAGNDTYILSENTIVPNGTIVIQDTEGVNEIQLVGGLTIASSEVFNNAIELTLSNGAVVQIVGASAFGFNVGGNALAGIPGTDQTFTEFVENTLGTTVPAEGEDPTTGGEVEIPGGTVEPEAPTFSVSTADVEEGGMATFTITLSEAQAEATTVDYAISLEGGASAADHGDITVDSVVDNTGSGTLTFAAGETTKVITIPVTEDDLSPEEGEGITVTLSNPTGADAELGEAAATADIIDVPVTFELTQDPASVQEGDTVTYTLTASVAVSADTDVSFAVVPGDAAAADQGTNDTNLNDFSQGSFNPSTVTMAAGTTTVQFSLDTVNDGITELPEDFSLEATIGGEVVDSVTTTLLDGAQGGQTFTLTTGTDTIQGTASNDTINASTGLAADGTTVIATTNPLDTIDGGDGIDTMNIENTGGKNTLTGTITNVENLTFIGAGNC